MALPRRAPRDHLSGVKPASMTLQEGVPLKEVLAPELWADFGLDPETGDPVV